MVCVCLATHAGLGRLTIRSRRTASNEVLCTSTRKTLDQKRPEARMGPFKVCMLCMPEWRDGNTSKLVLREKGQVSADCPGGERDTHRSPPDQGHGSRRIIRGATSHTPHRPVRQLSDGQTQERRTPAQGGRSMSSQQNRPGLSAMEDAVKENDQHHDRNQNQKN
jgi:hypothetical protein